MARVKPYSGTSAQRLTNLIKQSNPKLNRPDASFEFGVPVSMKDWLNTTVFTRPIIASVSGTAVPAPALFEEIQYRRLGLEVLNMLPACEVLPVADVTLPFTIHEILPKINEALGLNLAPEEVKNTRYANAAVSYKLEIADNNSLAWTESSYMFELDNLLAGDVRILEDGTVRNLESGEARTFERD